jgi:ssDNA-binding Zn-finger/Zn-ribbon topoisomerase 1
MPVSLAPYSPGLAALFAIHARTRIIRTKSEPSCPDCGAKMVLRWPPPEKDWDPFWGCILFPDCRGTLEINPKGTYETDDERWDT